ncbi:MAG: glutathionylspermidine synthase family protein, partial [Bacilli bacterium]
MNIQQHNAARNQFYHTIENFWPDLFGEPYALYDTYTMGADEVMAIRRASEQIIQVFDHTARILRELPVEMLSDLGIPDSLFPYIQTSHLPFDGVIRRLDLVPVNGVWKVLELNADTPTFIKECFHANNKLCEHLAVDSPNSAEERNLSHMLDVAIAHALSSVKEKGHVVFSAHDTHEEDWLTTKYLQSLTTFHSKCIPLHKLQVVQNKGLFTPNGERIACLYRQTYPIEFLCMDIDEFGEQIGLDLLQLVQDGHLQIINPLSAFLLQSKAVQAFIWALHEEHSELYSDEIHST